VQKYLIDMYFQIDVLTYGQYVFQNEREFHRNNEYEYDNDGLTQRPMIRK